MLSQLQIPKPSLEVRTETGKDSHPWFALQVKACYEKTVATLLHGKGYQWFLPLYKCKRRWSDRIKEIETPLFPGYLFCRFDMQHRLPILTTPGVLLIVGIGKTPIPIDQAEIAAIQTLVTSGLPSQPWPFLQIGERVTINYGALCGVEGILLDFKGRNRLVLSVTLLQRSVAVEIDGAWVHPIRQQHHVPTFPIGSRPLLVG